MVANLQHSPLQSGISSCQEQSKDQLSPPPSVPSVLSLLPSPSPDNSSLTSGICLRWVLDIRWLPDPAVKEFLIPWCTANSLFATAYCHWGSHNLLPWNYKTAWCHVAKKLLSLYSIVSNIIEKSYRFPLTCFVIIGT